MGLPGVHCLPACDDVGSCISSLVSHPQGSHIPCLAQPWTVSPQSCVVWTPSPPSASLFLVLLALVLAHRIHKGNSENVVSEEKQFFLEQASLSVVLGVLRKQRLA